MWPPPLFFTNERSLLLSGLLIGIAPRADFQAATDPAQRLFTVGRASGAANRALVHALELIGNNGTFRLIEKLLVDNRFASRQRFALHI